MGGTVRDPGEPAGDRAGGHECANTVSPLPDRELLEDLTSGADISILGTTPPCAYSPSNKRGAATWFTAEPPKPSATMLFISGFDQRIWVFCSHNRAASHRRMPTPPTM
ncbi:hypothetical protein AB0C14_32435 [Microbispora hainanensis]|uniref:hypothetical protein n=1 Tax=Microbispora hainanensis TaxID=568844 RepID=UPI0033DC9740